MANDTATFGGGSFFHLDAPFLEVEGVIAVRLGYMGGASEHPTHSDVLTGTTGHTEVVQVDFDPDVVSYEELLEVFFSNHNAFDPKNPLSEDHQGHYVWPHYRSVIFTHSALQEEQAKAKIESFQTTMWLTRLLKPKVVTQVESLQAFWPHKTTASA